MNSHSHLQQTITVITTTINRSPLSVSTEGKSVAALPASSPGTTNALVGTVTLLHHTTSMTTGRGETTAFTVLVDGVDDPVDGGIVADGGVVRIDEDDFVVLVGGILVDPVAVENTEVTADTANTAFGNGAEVASVLQLVDTLVLGLTVDNTLRIRSLASTTTDSNTVNNVTLLSLHAQSASLVGTSGVSDTADLGELTIFPSTNTKEVTHGIALLLSPEFFKILVGTHS